MWNNNTFHPQERDENSIPGPQQNLFDPENFAAFSAGFSTPQPWIFPSFQQFQPADYGNFTHGNFETNYGLLSQDSYMRNQMAIANPSVVNAQNPLISNEQNAFMQSVARPALDARAQELKARLVKRAAIRATSEIPSLKSPASEPSSKPGTMVLLAESSTAGEKSERTPKSSRATSVISDINALLTQGKATTESDSKTSNKKVTGHNLVKVNTPQQAAARQLNSSRPYTPRTPSSSRVDTSKGIDNLKGKGGGQSQLTTQNVDTHSSPLSEGEIREEPRPIAVLKENSKATEPKSIVKGKIEPEKDHEPFIERITYNPHYMRKDRHAKDTPEDFMYSGRDLPSPSPAVRPTDSSNKSIPNGPSGRSVKYKPKDGTPESVSVVHNSDKHEDTVARVPKYTVKNKESLPPRDEEQSLERLLPVNQDLKEWLDITGYHDMEYRHKILGRRRKIASLDEQKAILLEEIEREEKRSLPLVYTNGTTMPPPTIPVNASTPTPKINSASGTNYSAVPNPSTSKRDTETKRTYSELSDSNDNETSGGKHRRVSQATVPDVKAEREERCRLHNPSLNLSKHRSTHGKESHRKEVEREHKRDREPNPSRNRGAVSPLSRDVIPDEFTYADGTPSSYHGPHFDPYYNERRRRAWSDSRPFDSYRGRD